MNIIQWIGIGLVPAVLVILGGQLVRRAGAPAQASRRFLGYLLGVELLFLLAAGAAWVLAGGSRVSFLVTTTLAVALVGILISILLNLEDWESLPRSGKTLALAFGLALTGLLAFAWRLPSRGTSLVFFGLLFLAAAWMLVGQVSSTPGGLKRKPAPQELFGASDPGPLAVSEPTRPTARSAARPAARPVLALIHSPLVGPATWMPVGGALSRLGYPVIIPDVSDSGDPAAPYWERESASSAQAIDAAAHQQPVVLVAHSGAGPLLPAIAAALHSPVWAYIFVDAGIPVDGASYLDLMRSESRQEASEFQSLLESGEKYPNWKEADLVEVLPDEDLRQTVLAQVQPRGLDFFSAPLPVPAGWPDAPCAYLQFSPTYESYAQTARARGWLVRKMEGGHFHLLVEPNQVAQTILDLLSRYERKP